MYSAKTVILNLCEVLHGFPICLQLYHPKRYGQTFISLSIDKDPPTIMVIIFIVINSIHCVIRLGNSIMKYTKIYVQRWIRKYIIQQIVYSNNKYCIRSSSLIISMRCQMTSVPPVSANGREDTSKIHDLEKNEQKPVF